MSTSTAQALTIGNRITGVVGRTDEGTPVALPDFKGRALVVFPIENRLGRPELTLMKNIKRAIEDFHGYDCSPIVVSREAEEVLQAVRDQNHLPYLLLSDFSGGIHTELLGRGMEGAPGAVLVDDESMVIGVIPPMNGRELVTAVLSSLDRRKAQHFCDEKNE